MKHIIRRIIPIVLLLAGTLTGCSNPANNETHYVRLSDAACTFRHTDNMPFTIEVITSPDNWEARSSGSWLQAERQGTALVLTPEENLRLVRTKAHMKILEELGLSREESKRNIMHLSGGQRQRVAGGEAQHAFLPLIRLEVGGVFAEDCPDRVAFPRGNLARRLAAVEFIGVL